MDRRESNGLSSRGDCACCDCDCFRCDEREDGAGACPDGLVRLGHDVEKSCVFGDLGHDAFLWIRDRKTLCGDFYYTPWFRVNFKIQKT